MKKLYVSFQGEPGAFSEQAARAYFGSQCNPVAREEFRDVFEDVRKKKSFGIIPVENSLFGSVHQNFDLLREYHLYIVGEIKLRIKMNLLSLPGTQLKNIRHVYSHPQGLGQSDKFLRRLKNIQLHPFYDTAGSAKMIAEKQLADSAAIASEQAAIHYGLKILKKSIETDHRNFTRFVVLGTTPVIPKKPGKTSLLFATKNSSGALYQCLGVFALRNINLLKMESRPFVGKPWEYLFFVDVASDVKSKIFIAAIEELKKQTSFLKILGSYEPGRIVR